MTSTPASPVPPSSRDRTIRRRLAFGLLLALWGLITHSTFAGTGDEPHYQRIAQSIAFDRDLDLTNDYAQPDPLLSGGALAPGRHALPGVDGRLRPAHDIGMPLLFSPYYAVAHRLTSAIVARVPASWLERMRLNESVLLRHMLSLGMIAVTVFIALRLFDLFTAMSGQPARAAWWTALLVLSPPLLSHSFLFFTEIVSAALALVVFLALREPQLTVRHAALAGAAAGFLLLVHARNAGLILGLVTMAAFRVRLHVRARPWGAPWRDRTALAFFAAFALLIALRLFVTHHFWGTWLTTPHATLGAVSLGLVDQIVTVGTRLAGWLFDPKHGLLPYAPIYVLIPFGWIALHRRDRVLSAQLALVIGAYVLLMAVPALNAHGWRGGWSPAARFLVPIMPFLAIITFSTVAETRRIPRLIVPLVALQIALSALLWQKPKLLWNDEGETRSALAAYLFE